MGLTKSQGVVRSLTKGYSGQEEHIKYKDKRKDNVARASVDKQQFKNNEGGG